MTTAVSNRPLIKNGSKGTDVARIQTALQNAGFSPGSVDSDFGSKTEDAVRNFQKAHNLEVDGIVGESTWVLLQKYSKVHVAQPGDSLWKIAQNHNVSVDAIKKANPNIDEKNLPIGQEVHIPNAGGAVNATPQVQKYKIQPGDSFWKIAQNYNVSEDSIKKANPNIDEMNLPIGKVIDIPNARGGGEPTPQPHTSPSGERFKKAWIFFKNSGFSDGATAGIMGNLKHESTTLDPHQIQHNPRTGKPDKRYPGRGIAQWESKETPIHSRWAGRWEELVNWANNHGKNEYALQTQLEFIMYELEHEPATVSLLKKYGGVPGLKKLGINDALIAFLRCFERAGTEALGTRKQYAYELYNQFKGVKV